MRFLLYLGLLFLLGSHTAQAFKEDITVTDFEKIINTLAEWLGLIGGIIAVGGVVYAGIAFIRGGGNPEKLSQAKKIFWWSLGGGLIIIFAYGILNLIQNLLSRSSTLPAPSL